MIPCGVSCSSRLDHAGATALAMLIGVMLAGPACAQSGEPVPDCRSRADGKSALLAQHTSEEEIKAKGGLFGRPVKLLYYDDRARRSKFRRSIRSFWILTRSILL
jgi:hypothetical protein